MRAPRQSLVLLASGGDAERRGAVVPDEDLDAVRDPDELGDVADDADRAAAGPQALEGVHDVIEDVRVQVPKPSSTKSVPRSTPPDSARTTSASARASDSET